MGMTKQVVQLDNNGYFVGIAQADESPRRKGVWHMPANTIDADVPSIPDGFKAKWENNSWNLEEITSEEPLPEDPWNVKRMDHYPPIGDQLDDLFHAGLFSEEMAAKIQAIKDKYPKE